MRVLKELALSGDTVVCAAKQPSYEILSLFDKVMMSKGQIAFHGTTKQALSWFGGLGYFPLERSNPAEFLRTFFVSHFFLVLTFFLFQSF